MGGIIDCQMEGCKSYAILDFYVSGRQLSLGNEYMADL